MLFQLLWMVKSQQLSTFASELVLSVLGFIWYFACLSNLYVLFFVFFFHKMSVNFLSEVVYVRYGRPYQITRICSISKNCSWEPFKRFFATFLMPFKCVLQLKLASYPICGLISVLFSPLALH